MRDNAAVTPESVTCHACGMSVPEGEFCGLCGSHLIEDTPGAVNRAFAFAASPNEHVFHPNIVSTLFPHLPHRRAAPFRIGLLIAAVLLLALGYGRFTGPSIAVAALALPVLYLLYLYDVEVYGDEPVYVVGLTFVLGLVLSLPWAHFEGPFVSQTFVLQSTPGALPVGRLLTTIVLIPLGAQLLMLAGALLVYLTRRYDEALDGFSFGAAGAMGFVAGAVIVDLYPQLKEGLVSSAPAVNNALQIVSRGLLLPFIYACTTGLSAAALWVRRGRTRGGHSIYVALPTAVALAVVVQVGLAAVEIYSNRAALTVGIEAAVAILLLFITRVVIHHMLLAEAAEGEIGPPAPCFHCHRIVPRMPFCPNCGVATRATPKTGVGRTGRQVR